MDDDSNLNVSFAGCGFLGIYHIGVASCIKEYAPHLFSHKVSGASVGALAGVCLLTDIPLATFASDMLHMVHEIRQKDLGPFNPLIHVQNMLKNLIATRIPKDAYKMVSGKLFVSVTQCFNGKNVILSEFSSNEELSDALLASAFVPIFSGFVPPKIGQFRCVDGGFSNNLPVHDANTITVSPFCGESDICPRDSTMQLFHINLCNTSVELSTENISRFHRVLFPHSPEVLAKLCRQGFEDALKFLHRRNLMSCNKCAPHITLSVVERPHSHGENGPYNEECQECILHIKKALSSDLPEAVRLKFEHATEKWNKELEMSWSYKMRNANKMISVMTSPYVLAFDTLQAIMKKFAGIFSERVQNAVEMIIKMQYKMNKTGLFLASITLGSLSISIHIDDLEKNLAPELRSKSLGKINLQVSNNANAIPRKIVRAASFPLYLK